MPKCDKHHAKWKANMAKCSKYHAKCKVTMPKCSKYHAKWQVLVPNWCKDKANGTRKESHKQIHNLRQKIPKTILHPLTLGVQSAGDSTYSSETVGKCYIFGSARDGQEHPLQVGTLGCDSEGRQQIAGIIPHTWSTEKGYNGAPLLIRSGSSFKIVGLHICGKFISIGGEILEENYAASISALDRLRTRLGFTEATCIRELSDVGSVVPPSEHIIVAAPYDEAKNKVHQGKKKTRLQKRQSAASMTVTQREKYRKSRQTKFCPEIIYYLDHPCWLSSPSSATGWTPLERAATGGLVRRRILDLPLHLIWLSQPHSGRRPSVRRRGKRWPRRLPMRGRKWRISRLLRCAVHKGSGLHPWLLKRLGLGVEPQSAAFLKRVARAVAAREGSDAAQLEGQLVQELSVTARAYRARAVLHRRAGAAFAWEAPIAACMDIVIWELAGDFFSFFLPTQSAEDSHGAAQCWCLPILRAASSRSAAFATFPHPSFCRLGLWGLLNCGRPQFFATQWHYWWLIVDPSRVRIVFPEGALFVGRHHHVGTELASLWYFPKFAADLSF